MANARMGKACLDARHGESDGLQEQTGTGGNNALAHTGDNTWVTGWSTSCSTRHDAVLQKGTWKGWPSSVELTS